MAEFKANFKNTKSGFDSSFPGRLIFGIPGKDGGYYLIAAEHIDENTIRFTFTPSQNGMPEVPPVDMDIPGATDEQIRNNIENYLRDNPVIGKPGDPGFSPIAKVIQTEEGATIAITDKDGTTTATILNGVDGESVTIESVIESTEDGGDNVVAFSDGTTLTIKNGRRGTSGGEASAESVLYVDQDLSEDQQAQARKNIDATSMDEVKEMLGIEDVVEFSETGELVELNVDIEPGTELNVVSKIHRDSTWGESNKLVLHQVSGTNFVDLSSYLGGVGKVFEKNGLTATVNADGTLTVTGTNASTGWANLIDVYHWSGDYATKVYPAGTYIIPSGLTINVRAAQYPDNVTIPGVSVNIKNKLVATQPFRVLQIMYAVAPGGEVDSTIPLGLFRSDSIPEIDYKYTGNIYTATFDGNVYEGEYNWTTGELKDVDGNTVAYYEPQSIAILPGVNYFWTGFGENTVSNNSSDNLDKVIIRLGESAPAETVPSICDFTLTPTTKNYAINLAGDNRYFFDPSGNLFHGMEVPLITTRGKFVVADADGKHAYDVPVTELINYKGIADTMTGNNVIKRWSNRFYITKEPDFAETVDDGSGNTNNNPNSIATWIFTKEQFEDFGLPVKEVDIPVVSPVFTQVTSDKLTSTKCGFANTFLCTFSYDETNDYYVFKCRARDLNTAAIYKWTKGYFCYPLKEAINRDDNMVSLYLSAGYSVRFEQDDAFDVFWDYTLTQGWCPFMKDTGTQLWNPNTKPADASAADSLIDVTPNVGIFVPRSIEDALYEAEHIAKRLNKKTEQTDDYELNSYRWIGEGDGTTDYTEKIQSKLTEIHNTSDGGTIHLGPGTYPISGSLIVYDNTRIIGDGRTIIEQTADNTHALILSGSNITIRDLSIMLSGACTTLTACIIVNSQNHPNEPEHYDSTMPINIYAQNLTVNDVRMMGKYSFAKENGYPVISDDYENYKGVGIYSPRGYFNYAHVDNAKFNHLMAGVYGGGGANYYNVTSEFCKYGLYITNYAGDNTYFVSAHSYYAIDANGNYISMSDMIAYVDFDQYSSYYLKSYDMQAYKSLVFLSATTDSNKIDVQLSLSLMHGLHSSHEWNILDWFIIDYGRGNTYRDHFKNTPFHIGNATTTIAQTTQFELSNPVIQNVLSGAGVWGKISTNVEFTDHGISLQDVCRYPSEKTVRSNWLPYILSTVSPTKENPIEIVIDYSNRPVVGVPNYFIQFDHRHVASDYVVSFDTTNTGVFDFEAQSPVGNTNLTEYFDYPQTGAQYITYRMKITFTKALQIADLPQGLNKEEADYNPDGLIGICNIGMTVNDYAGRSFLGECGGSLYGNVDMHQNTLKNLPAPVEDGDAVSKAYLEERLAALEALISRM